VGKTSPVWGFGGTIITTLACSVEKTSPVGTSGTRNPVVLAISVGQGGGSVDDSSRGRPIEPIFNHIEPVVSPCFSASFLVRWEKLHARFVLTGRSQAALAPLSPKTPDALLSPKNIVIHKGRPLSGDDWTAE